jgi:Tfp pilus assembly protein PilX
MLVCLLVVLVLLQIVPMKRVLDLRNLSGIIREVAISFSQFDADMMKV